MKQVHASFVGVDDGWLGRAGASDREGMMMNVEERIRFLLGTAVRAEGKGDFRIAQLFRRMAEDMRPMEHALSAAGP
ncbi:MAG: hypothetical protein HOB12_12375 [Gemmatimonadales bacterium]|nr:hypothetical protein [Gemmatimonadales bacterium]MBT6696441.1 hypothetical protein [Gemmatimonadales bacterium]